MRNWTLCIFGLLAIWASARLNPDLSKTPPMGFNSWNHFNLEINEQIFKDIADAFVRLGLDVAGYKYINVDDGWLWKERGEDGHIRVMEPKFPNGLKHLSDYIHSKGLKFGLYADGGLFTCGWGAGSLGYEKIDAADFEAWGVDYLKYDNCHNQGIPSIYRYAAMAEALYSLDREIFFSVCNWGLEDVNQWGFRLGAGSWRTSQDISDNWWSMKQNFRELIEQTNPNGYGPGKGWNDPDMLEVGNGGMSTEEYKTHFSIWCMMKSPLLIGNDVRNMTKEDEAIKILTNMEAIAVNQDPLGKQAECVMNCNKWLDNVQVWVGPLVDNAYVVAIINFSDHVEHLGLLCWREAKLPHPVYLVRDLWEHQVEGIYPECYPGAVYMKPHHIKFLKIMQV